MAEAKLQFLLDLEDRVSPGMQKIATQLDDFKGKVEDMKPAFQKMATVGVAGFTAITGVVALSIKAYGDAERSQRQLEHAVIDVSHGTMEQVAAISDLSDALQRKAGIDGDALKQGAAQLSTFGLTSGAVVNLTKSLADLTVNQNGVNASSDQYVQSANVIAKALNGQFGVLEKSGIRFTEAQQNMILYGKESEKVAALQQGLAQNLRETTDTLGGVDAATAKATRGMGEVFEAIGKSFAPAVAKLSDAITPLIYALTDWISKNPNLAATILAVGAGLFALVAIAGTLGLILPAIIGGFSALATVAGVLAGAVLAITWPVALVIAAIVALIAVGYLLYTHWSEISAFAGETWAAIEQMITGAMQAVGDTVSRVWEGVKAAFWTAVDFIIGAVASLLDWLVPGWDAALLSLYAKAVEIWNLITAFFSTTFESISAGITGVLEVISAKWSEIWNGMKDVFSTIWSAIAAVFDSVVSGITSAMNTLVGPIQRVIDLAERALSLAGGVVKSVGGGISSAVSSIINRGASITGKAIGGPVSGGTPYIVGERGPELFVPGMAGSIVPNHALAGGPSISVVITGNTLLDRDAARKIGDEMVRYLKDNLRI